MTSFDFTDPPTAAQLDYADALIERLQRSQNAATNRFRREVTDCTSKTVMTGIIRNMRRILDDIRDADRGLG